MREQRQFLRMRFGSRVQVSHPAHGAAVFRTGDVSDGGVYLLNGPFELAVGDEISMQILDMPEEGPVVRVLVVRVDPGGVGLRFAE
jgi:hypothetical protein